MLGCCCNVYSARKFQLKECQVDQLLLQDSETKKIDSSSLQAETSSKKNNKRKKTMGNLPLNHKRKQRKSRIKAYIRGMLPFGNPHRGEGSRRKLHTARQIWNAWFLVGCKKEAQKELCKCCFDEDIKREKSIYLFASFNGFLCVHSKKQTTTLGQTHMDTKV